MAQSQTSPEQKEIRDDRGVLHVLTERLGGGGQGTAYRTQDPRVLVKLVELPAERAQERKARQDRLRLIARLGLQDRLPLAVPESLVETDESIGYTMRMLEDMVPLSELLRIPSASVGRWYKETGGLRRRLRLLAELADVMAALHGEGLVYGDLSPSNVFVSGSIAEVSTWLIDTDNVRWSIAADTESFFTPPYGAPELVKATGPASPSSDAWSLAVLTYQLLTLNHPFLAGDLVQNGDPEEAEAAAGRGELPWVHDTTNDENSTSGGIDWELVLTKHLRALCERTFGAGRGAPETRPTAGEWAEGLHRASQITLTCEHCGQGYFAFRLDCPWCKRARSRFYLLEARAVPSPVRTEPELQWQAMSIESPWWRAVVTPTEPLLLTRRMVTGELGARGRQPVATLTAHAEGVYVRPEPGAELFLTADQAQHRPDKDQPILKPCKVAAASGIRVGRAESVHTWLRFVAQ